MIPTAIDVLARPVAHLPFVRAVLDQLGILDHIEGHCPTHTLNRVSDAQCVGALILNALCGRPSLYRMDEWLGRLDLEVLFGPEVDGSAFNDTRLATALDHLDAVGTDNVLAGIARAYLAQDDGECCVLSIHHDTTSVVLQGAYDTEAQPKPAYGHSKDHRPDLKQLIFGLSLHGATGVPLIASVQAGNTSDVSVARDHLSQLVDILPAEHEVTFVGDCKLVDAKTLGGLLRSGLHFVSLVPDAFNLREELIREAWVAHPDLVSWPVLAEKPGRSKAADPMTYRGMSFTRPFRLVIEPATKDTAAVEVGEEMRFLVVHSETLSHAFDASIESRLVRESDKLQKAAKRANGRGFACETDARAAGVKVAESAEFHRVHVGLITREVPIKRAKAGRPRKGDTVETRTVWHFELALERDDAVIASTRQRRSCFVLATDWDQETWADQRVLAEYRHQHIVEGHTGFRWLKGPAAVAPVFLKTPQRIRAMGLVLVLALMVRNYIQATMRAELVELGETLPHPFTKKPERSLTTEMAFEHFGGVTTEVLTLGEERRRMPVRLSVTARRILGLFALDETVYSGPPRPVPRRKWQRAPSKSPGM